MLVFMADIFDSSLNLEETHFKEAEDEGYKDGLITGKDESKQVGLKVCFELGEELGFYRGYVDVWSSAIRVDPNCFSSRVKISIKQMDELIEKYQSWILKTYKYKKSWTVWGSSSRWFGAQVQDGLFFAAHEKRLVGYPKSSSDAKDTEFLRGIYDV